MVAEFAARLDFFAADGAYGKERFSAVFTEFASLFVFLAAGGADDGLSGIPGGGRDVAHGGAKFIRRFVQDGHRFVLDISADLPVEAEREEHRAHGNGGEAQKQAPETGGRVARSEVGEDVDKADDGENDSRGEDDPSRNLQEFFRLFVAFVLRIAFVHGKASFCAPGAADFFCKQKASAFSGGLLQDMVDAKGLEPSTSTMSR